MRDGISILIRKDIAPLRGNGFLASTRRITHSAYAAKIYMSLRATRELARASVAKRSSPTKILG